MSYTRDRAPTGAEVRAHAGTHGTGAGAGGWLLSDGRAASVTYLSPGDWCGAWVVRATPLSADGRPVSWPKADADGFRILAIDPGTRSSGWVLYDATARRVIRCDKATPNDDAVRLIRELRPDRVACERVSAGRFSGADYLVTSEQVGAVRWEAIREGIPYDLLPRRDVLRELAIPFGAGADSRVRRQMIERHGGDRASAVGRKASPGPLYGVASHAWQALGLAVAVALREGLWRA